MAVRETVTKPLAVVAVAALLAALSSAAPLAQEREGRGRGLPGRVGPGPGPGLPGVTPGEIQQLFDAYVVMQAQQELQLNEERFGAFLTRVRALQEVRRRGQMQRQRMLQELRRVSQSGPDEQVKTTLERFNELEKRNAEEVKEAIEKVDEVLELRQRARFRLLEEHMERRKLDLLMRARQQNRARDQF
jgi:hypothetical protein